MTDPMRQPKTLGDHLRALGTAAVIVAVSLLLLELLLALVDPWGMRYFTDLAKMAREDWVVDSQRGYKFPAGTYEYSHWSATIVDGARYLPQAGPDANCAVVILGDSVAFGYGVDDEDVWLNQIVPDLPDVTFLNTGVPRYNSTNVLRTYQAFPDADAYLYLIVNNDIEPAIDLETHVFTGSGEGLPFVVRYVNFGIYFGGQSRRPPDPDGQFSLAAPDTQRFLSEVNALRADERMTLVGFQAQAITNTLQAQEIPVEVVPYAAEERISVADNHLNETGNRLMAEDLQPIVENVVQTHCP